MQQVQQLNDLLAFGESCATYIAYLLLIGVWSLPLLIYMLLARLKRKTLTRAQLLPAQSSEVHLL